MCTHRPTKVESLVVKIGLIESESEMIGLVSTVKNPKNVTFYVCDTFSQTLMSDEQLQYAAGGANVL